MVKMYYTCKPVGCIRCEASLEPSKMKPRLYCPTCSSSVRLELSGRVCEECDSTFTPIQRAQRHCSKKCRMAEYDRSRGWRNRLGVGPPPPLSCPRCEGPTPGRRGKGGRSLCSDCRSTDSQPVRRTEYLVRCDVCMGAFTSTAHNAKYCSDRCRRQRISNRLMGLYRTAMANLEIKQASMWHHKLCAYLADRDDGKCHICNKRVDLSLSSGPRGNVMGPSIDHLVPSSLGGTDDLSNLALTHWGCNRDKRATPTGEQLRLVG